MTYNQSEMRDAIDYQRVRSIGKLLFATLSLLFLLSVVSLLPGIGLFVPNTPITLYALASAIVTLAVVGLLLYVAPGLARLTRATLGGPDEIVDDVASVVHLLVVLAAVLVAHRGLAPAVTPFLEDATWAYDVTFLLISLPLLAVVASQLYASLDPAADLFADRIAGSSAADDATTASTAERSNADDDSTTEGSTR
ncbi:hypothetical protein ACFOZ7_18100 [Natribaculum luteum]|uniref:Uncharacterized protein n=1 Tax=Natribaculum luteum TaxID=1586232 RepID=A0ABD5P3J3_9EURY|nr:hypothetical protein [Natribaculum luteum]